MAVKSNRRELLKLSSMGALGGLALSSLAAERANAEEEPPNISYASWIHGHSMEIEYPDRIIWQVRKGYAYQLEGKPGTANWFHFAIPTPVIVNDVRLRIDSIILRFLTGSVDAFVRDVHIYDGEKHSQIACPDCKTESPAF